MKKLFKARYEHYRSQLCWLFGHNWIMPQNRYNRVCTHCQAGQHKAIYDINKWVDNTKPTNA